MFFNKRCSTHQVFFFKQKKTYIFLCKNLRNFIMLLVVLTYFKVGIPHQQKTKERSYCLVFNALAIYSRHTQNVRMGFVRNDHRGKRLNGRKQRQM